MDFNWRSPVLPRIAFLTATIFLFAIFAINRNEWLLTLIFLILSIIQIKLLIEYLERSHKNISSFLDSIEFDDLSYSFKTESDDPDVKRLHQELNHVLLKLRNAILQKHRYARRHRVDCF
jgi:two-component system nitrogen regulation sensor histidine kinase NtrY